MRLEQRHTCSRRRRSGRNQRAANGGRLDESSIKGVPEPARELGPAGSRNAPHALGLSRAESHRRGRRRRAAPRHSARARMAAVTAPSLGSQPDDWLHVRQGGAEDGDGKPDQTFHGNDRIAL
jgi:hypothetical protein